MARWAGAIIFVLIIALFFAGREDILVWMGGFCLGAILLSLFLDHMLAPLLGRLRKDRGKRRAGKIDWKVIEKSAAEDRPKRDCEREESPGICTGPECFEYPDCHFNIKKPLPG